MSGAKIGLLHVRDAGIGDVEGMERLVAGSEILLSVCPPHAARAQAETVARLGFHGLYVDANAVSPDTSREISGSVEKAGVSFVDGGIVGPPARSPGSTHAPAPPTLDELARALLRRTGRG